MRRFSVVFTAMLVPATIGFLYDANAYFMQPAEQPKNAKAQQEESPLSGKIVETMNSGGYTYMLLEKDGKRTWVAVKEMKVAVGENVTLEPGHEMTNFTSQTLNRTFDKIIFSTGLSSSYYHSYEAMGSKGSMAVTPGNIKVEKASGQNSYTVAELYARRTELDQKNVVLRGKVVKVSTGILAKNWLHIQDGTGSADAGTHDIVVTTQDLPSVGDIVTANGVLFKDKDFGSGYKYDVIVEKAAVKKE
ncbi:MAG: DNA-binding protein [Candidatus Loosdrechtia sp.]|uniref:DNA-binding protein n=1 Tax=Candidatus Loosdrechtia sp. TaxID=3101272 RepID=UPI003A701C99|nr:MAG: DNA-binding protein [Candidatus Jettenia sp. AMX2]